MNIHKRMHHMLWLIVPCLLRIFTLRFSGEIQFYLFLSVGTDAQWNCQVGKKWKYLFSNTKDASHSLDSKALVLRNRKCPIKPLCIHVNTVPWSWFWWWIRSPLQLIWFQDAREGLIFAEWQVVVLWLFFSWIQSFSLSKTIWLIFPQWYTLCFLVFRDR